MTHSTNEMFVGRKVTETETGTVGVVAALHGPTHVEFVAPGRFPRLTHIRNLA